MPPVAAAIAAGAGALGAAGAPLTLIGAVGAGTSLGGIGMSLVGIGASVGLSLIARALQPRPASPAQGGEISTTFGTNLPARRLIGTKRFGGVIDYRNTFGGANEVVETVYFLGLGVHDELLNVYVDGEARSLVANNITTGWRARLDQSGCENYLVLGGRIATDKPDRGMTVRFWRGTMTQAADSRLVANSRLDKQGSPRWTGDMYGRGCCYAVVTHWPDDAQGLSADPRIEFQLRGARLYDWRQDSTFPGGSGAQRFADPATWTYSDNPVVVEYNHRRGLWINGVLVLGMGRPADELNMDMYTAAANACDQAVALKAGGTEPRYRVAMEEFSRVGERTFADNIDAYLEACAGVMVERAGVFGPIAGVARTPVATITDNDWDPTTRFVYRRDLPVSDRRNAVQVNVSDPAKGYQTGPSGPLRRSSADEATDGEQKPTTIDLAQVTSLTQGQRLAEIARRAFRRGGTITGGLPVWWSFLEAGDEVTYVSAKRGWTKVFRVLSVKRVSSRSIVVDMRETASSVWSWTAAADELDPETTPDLAGDVAFASTPSSVAAAAATVTGANGQALPAIRVVFASITDPRVDAVVIRYRVKTTTEWRDKTLLRQEFLTGGVAFITDGVQASTLYELQSTLLTTPQRDTSWSPLIEVTTGATYVVPTASQALSVAPDTITLAMLHPDVEATWNNWAGGPEVAGSIANARALADAARKRADDILTALHPSRSVRATVSADLRADVTQTIDSLIETVSRLQEQFYRHREGVISAGIEIDPGSGRGVMRAIATSEKRFSEVSVTIDALRAQVSLLATVGQTGDLSGVLANVAQVQLDLDALEASLTGYVTQAQRTGDQAVVTGLSSSLSALTGVVGQKADQITVDGINTRVTTAESTLDLVKGQATTAITAAQRAEGIAGPLPETLDDILGWIRDRLEENYSNIANASWRLGAGVNENGRAIATATLDLAALTEQTAARFTSEITARAEADGALSERIDALNVSLGTKADASAVNTLSATVTAQGATLGSQASSITALSGRVTDVESVNGAQGSAVAALETTQTAQGNQITTLSTAVTDLFAAYNGVSANALMQASASVAGDNSFARIDLRVRITAGETPIDSGIAIQALRTGGVVTTSVIIKADRFFVVGNDNQPFALFDAASKRLILDRAPIITGSEVAAGTLTKTYDVPVNGQGNARQVGLGTTSGGAGNNWQSEQIGGAVTIPSVAWHNPTAESGSTPVVLIAEINISAALQGYQTADGSHPTTGVAYVSTPHSIFIRWRLRAFRSGDPTEYVFFFSDRIQVERDSVIFITQLINSGGQPVNVIGNVHLLTRNFYITGNTQTKARTFDLSNGVWSFYLDHKLESGTTNGITPANVVVNISGGVTIAALRR